jgi:putative DNA primase/helicase
LTDKNNTHLEIGNNNDDDNDDAAGSHRGGNQMDKKEKQFQQAMTLVRDRIVFSKNKSGVFHATISEHDGISTFPVGSLRLLAKVKKIVFGGLKLRLSKPVQEELVEELREEADTPAIDRFEVHHRVAQGSNGQIYIDLCNTKSEVLEVDGKGYRLHDFAHEMPLFLRSPGMAALPDPIGAQPNLELLRCFVNVTSENSWRLVIVYLLYCYRPGGPYVILVVNGTAGSGKSNFSRLIRRLVDPSPVSTQSLPESTLDLMITANNSHMLVFDNVRQLTHKMSDALCSLATGAGVRIRMLFTNSEETMFYASRPCVLNGIGDVANQTDLLSRCVQLELPVIKVRRTEEEFNRKFEHAIGPIFAGLMDALSKTLAALPGITEAPESRMADFELFGMAVERALNWPVGSFKCAYARNQASQMRDVLCDDVLAQALRALVQDEVQDGIDYTKTPTELLKELDTYVSNAERASKADWPQSPHSLSKRLKKIEPALRACGIGVSFNHSGNRTITLTRLKRAK